MTIDVQLPNSQLSDITLHFKMGAVAKIYFEFTKLYMKHGNCSIFFHVLKLAVMVVVRMVIPVKDRRHRGLHYQLDTIVLSLHSHISPELRRCESF